MTDNIKFTNDMSDNTSNEYLSKVRFYFDEHPEFWPDLYDQPNSGNDIVLAKKPNIAR